MLDLIFGEGVRVTREGDGADYFRKVRGMGDHGTLRPWQVVDFD